MEASMIRPAVELCISHSDPRGFVGKHFVVCEAAAFQTGFRLHLEEKLSCRFDSSKLDNWWCLVVEKV